MFTRIQFPSEAFEDVRELVSLSDVQLQALAELLNTKEATPPVKPDFVKTVKARLEIDSEKEAESVTRLATVLQNQNLDATEAAEVVSDLKALVIRECSDDDNSLYGFDEKSEALAKVIQRQPEISRQLKLRRLADGTQPAIESIRTLVQLRPFFERGTDGSPRSIECMVPAMTLELSFEKNDRSQSATFSLNEETLVSLIENLQDARLKWQMLNDEYFNQVCK